MSLEEFDGYNLSLEYLRNVAGCDDLENVEELELVKLSIKDVCLKPSIFNQLQNLVELDLSYNCLTCLPDGIILPKLQYLDISFNHLREVTWLERFKELVDLNVQGNVQLTIDDQYKIIFLLQNLQVLDKKRIDNREKFCSEYTNGILTQFENIWETQNFSKKGKSSKQQLMKDFVEVAKRKEKYGPSSLKEYRKWRIEHLAGEFIETKLNRPSDTVILKLSRHFANSPRKTNKRKPDDAQTVQNVKCHKSVCKESLVYKPQTLLQCHSKESGPKDFTTQVWCCNFEPNKDITNITTNIVATCGGDTVCLINVDTMKVVSKFFQPNEEFFTLAWTTIEIVEQKSNILAAAGCLGFIHLIHPDQDLCYGRIKIHSSPVQSLVFSPSGPTHLLSADRKGNIYMTDIDIPTIPEYKFSWKKLMVFTGLDTTPLKLLVPDKLHLLCATEFGLYCWKTKGFANSNAKTISLLCEITFPYVDPDVRIVDALSLLCNDVVALKCAQQGSIFVWRFSDIDKEISKAVNRKNGQVAAKIAAELKWSDTKQCYLSIACCSKQKMIAAGDEKGNLWLYSVADALKTSIANSIVDPVNIVPLPMCTNRDGGEVSDLSNGTIFNDVACNCDMKYIVAACDNNLVCIYKQV